MRTEEAADILAKLALGTDPFTGQELSTDTVLNRAEVIRALVLAAELLRSKAAVKSGVTPLRAGRPWSSLEDGELAEMFAQRISLSEIAQQFGRTAGAITARIVRIGLASDRQAVRDLLRRAK